MQTPEPPDASEQPRSVVPVALMTGGAVVAVLLVARWIDHRADDAPATRVSDAERPQVSREALTVAEDTARPRDDGGFGQAPVPVAKPEGSRVESAMGRLLDQGRPIVRCRRAEPYPAEAARPRVTGVTGQPPGAHLLAFPDETGIWMSLPDRTPGTATLEIEGFVPIDIAWEAPSRRIPAGCTPNPLVLEEAESGVVGVVFAGDDPAPGERVTARCGDAEHVTETDEEGGFFLPTGAGTCAIVAGDTDRDAPWKTVTIDPDDDAEIELSVPTGGPQVAASGGGFTITRAPARGVVNGIELHAGDVIVSIDGVPAGEVAEDLLMDVLSGRNGPWLALEDGETTDGAVRVRLQPL